MRRRNLRRIRQAALKGVFSHYGETYGSEGWIDDVPLIVPITGACENVSTLFHLTDYPGRYLTQTGQLSLEVELQDTQGVYCSISSFRADHEDARHLNEFKLIEAEFSCWSVGISDDAYDPGVMLNRLLESVTASVSAMLEGALSESVALEELGGDPASLKDAIKLAEDEWTWPSISYSEALELLNVTGQFEHLDFGVDLGHAQEAALLDLMSARYAGNRIPVFVTHYPEQIKFFNMKTDPLNTNVVLSADLLLPTAGEAVGAAVREDHLPTLKERLRSSSMLRNLEDDGSHKFEDFAPYLRLIGGGRVPPHAGYGIGLERVMQFMVNEPDIRQVSGIHGLSLELGPDSSGGA